MVVQLADSLVLAAVGLESGHRSLQPYTLLLFIFDILSTTLDLDTKLMLLRSAYIQLLLDLSQSLPRNFKLLAHSLKVGSLIVLDYFI